MCYEERIDLLTEREKKKKRAWDTVNKRRRMLRESRTER